MSNTPIILGDLTCYNCDCMELMKSMPDKSVDFVLSDLPYELSPAGGIKHGDFANRKHAKRREHNPYYFISKGIDYDAVFAEFIRLLKVVNLCVFCSNKQVGKIMTWWEQRGYTATLLVWDKPNPIPLGQGHYISNLEFIIYVSEKGAPFNDLDYAHKLKSFHYQPPQAKDRIHETEKPTTLLAHLLRIHTSEGDIVFDPYAGSFTTALACQELHRKFIGCEILEKYYTPSVARIRKHQQQLTLF